MVRKAALFTVLVVLVALLVFGVYSAYLDLKPREVVSRKNVTVATYELGYDHSSVVVKENPLWEAGSRLSNMDVYFLRTNPDLNVTFRFALPGENFEVEYETKLVVMSSASDKVFWKLERVIASGKELVSTDVFTRSFVVAIPEIKREIESVERSLEFRGGTKVVKIVTSVEARGNVGGEKKVVRDEVEMTLKISDSYYTVSTSAKKGKIEKSVESKRVVFPSQRDYLFALLKIAAPLFGIAVAVISYRTYSLPDDVKERRKFRKWISFGKLPSRSFVEVELNSLEDLVDAAIDMNERVIYDGSENVYFFVHGEVMYVYVPKNARRGEEVRS